jgi:hypothetical protein
MFMVQVQNPSLKGSFNPAQRTALGRTVEELKSIGIDRIKDRK